MLEGRLESQKANDMETGFISNLAGIECRGCY